MDLPHPTDLERAPPLLATGPVAANLPTKHRRDPHKDEPQCTALQGQLAATTILQLMDNVNACAVTSVLLMMHQVMAVLLFKSQKVAHLRFWHAVSPLDKSRAGQQLHFVQTLHGRKGKEFPSFLAANKAEWMEWRRLAVESQHFKACYHVCYKLHGRL